MTDFIPAAKETLHKAHLMNRMNKVIQDEINLIATTAVGKKCGMHAIFANLQHANHANYGDFIMRIKSMLTFFMLRKFGTKTSIVDEIVNSKEFNDQKKKQLNKLFSEVMGTLLNDDAFNLKIIATNY